MKHYPLADQPELIEEQGFQLAQDSIEDPERRLKRELDKRESDTRVKQCGFDWAHDTRMIDGAMGKGHVSEASQPWNRAANHGITALSDYELIRAMIGDLGVDLLEAAGSFEALATWSISQLETFKGITRRKASLIASVFEVNKRVSQSSYFAKPFDCVEVTYEFLRAECLTMSKENFFVLTLNRKNHLIKKHSVSIGTATSALVHPREVFREAIFDGASAIIIAHNHPSGDPAPSRADIQVTLQLREAAKTIEIDLLDHVIVGKRDKDPQGLGFYSFNNAGLI